MPFFRQSLTTKRLYAPVYFILGGVRGLQGCVITRETDRTLDVWELGSEKTHSWYLLQTNYDHWTTPPFFDDRVAPGERCMNRFGPQVLLV